MKSLQVRLSDSLYKKTKEFADHKEITIADVLRRALETYLDYDLRRD